MGVWHPALYAEWAGYAPLGSRTQKKTESSSCFQVVQTASPMTKAPCLDVFSLSQL